LSYTGNLLVENRNGLMVAAEVFQANGTAERDAALVMLEQIPGTKPLTVASLWSFRVNSRRCLRFIACQLFCVGRQIAFWFFSCCLGFMLIFHGELNSARPGRRALHSLSIGVGPLFFSEPRRHHPHNRQYRSHAPLSGRNAPENMRLSCRAWLCHRF